MNGNLVWLASYPKSGNTWLRVLLENWRRDAAGPVGINALTRPGWQVNSRSQFEACTLLATDCLTAEEVEGLRPAVHRYLAAEVNEPSYLKVHNAFSEAFRGVARAAVYIVRDPRDVAGSLAAHLDVSVDEAIGVMNSRGTVLRGRGGAQLPQALLDWSGHVGSWVDGGDCAVHVVRYEDLPGAFAGVLAFLGETGEAGRLERAIRHSRFDELRRQEAAGGFVERMSAHPFFRQGRAGGWRETLTSEQAGRIVGAHGETMERFGYLGARAAWG